ncbi:DNA-directed RNA polymerase subunit alpha C-terminal domain-containing protein [Clostridium sporogenes]|uniref:DNA-directed RNA polymerase subunit alpha C-terminal domain-containing protein n=1 Tax=Clostridium sporogenes TaxID=1509 RepID=UPI000A565F51|nr:DNA-directed RNA polymerase subunit alpha C-terminal domain-containing protein [Clostridium sporogenes]MDS1006584.1 DNA-directed RNA polymerase subunit alpha C-terminal domain-containing protein [Clostridium sporogenes]
MKKIKKNKDELRELNLSITAYNSLRNMGINTLEDFSMYSKKQLCQFKGIGISSLRKIEKVLDKKNIKMEVI